MNALDDGRKAARGTGEQESAAGICSSCHRQWEARGSTWLITYTSHWAGSATGQLNYSSKQRQQSEIKADNRTVSCTGQEGERLSMCVQGWARCQTALRRVLPWEVLWADACWCVALKLNEVSLNNTDLKKASNTKGGIIKSIAVSVSEEHYPVWYGSIVVCWGSVFYLLYTGFAWAERCALSFAVYMMESSYFC